MFGVQMPFDNTIAVSHKWATGDTGGKIHLSYGIPAMCVDSGNLTFYLWSASNVTVTLWSM
jgi:hypothetical protein